MLKRLNQFQSKNDNLRFVLLARLFLLTAHLNHCNLFLVTLTLNCKARGRLANARGLDAVVVARVPHGVIGQVVAVLDITSPALFLSLKNH